MITNGVKLILRAARHRLCVAAEIYSRFSILYHDKEKSNPITDVNKQKWQVKMSRKLDKKNNTKMVCNDCGYSCMIESKMETHINK